MADDAFHQIIEQAYRAGGGDPDDTVPAELEALVETERELGSDHPDTLSRRINLGYAYYAAGRLDEAIALNEQAFGDCARILGAADHGTFIAGNNLASAYREAGRLD